MTTHPRTDARMTPTARRFLTALAAPLDARPDAELLDRFARYGERPALETLVRRHAPLVRGVCRRHLGHGPDADDAFQATFLVLLRRTGRGRPPANPGPWLYGVAVKTAARLRSRRKPEPLPEVADRTPAADPAADWVPLLDQELAGLPAKYRDALVLCELQGRSRRDAAALLGVAEGTLSSRLSRGRELLRRRLLRHGTLLPAAALAALTAGEVASAEVIAATVALTDGAVPAAVAAAVPPAGWGLWKLVAGGVLAAGLAVGLAAGPGDKPVSPPAPAAKPADAPAPATAGPAVPNQKALQGVWLLEDMPLSETGRQKLAADGRVAAQLAAEVEALKGYSRLVVHGDRWFQLFGDYYRGWSFALDPARNPKRLDLSDGSTPPKVIRSIYALAGDRLTVATGYHDRRPADLGPNDDPDRAETLVYRRGPPADPVTAAAVKPLLGRWTMVRHRGNAGGKVTETRWGWLEVLPDALFFQTGDAQAVDSFPRAATFTLDPAKNHPWIDLHLLTTPRNNQPGKRFGVYELAGDTLKLVFGHDRAFRPLDFEVEPYQHKRLSDADGGVLALPDGPDPRVECFEFRRAK